MLIASRESKIVAPLKPLSLLDLYLPGGLLAVRRWGLTKGPVIVLDVFFAGRSLVYTADRPMGVAGSSGAADARRRLDGSTVALVLSVHATGVWRSV
jgi:hypothetical protein